MHKRFSVKGNTVGEKPSDTFLVNTFAEMNKVARIKGKTVFEEDAAAKYWK